MKRKKTITLFLLFFEDETMAVPLTIVCRFVELLLGGACSGGGGGEGGGVHIIIPS